MKPHIDIGEETPWGPAQAIRDLGHGCFIVTTPVEGGLYVSDRIKKHLPIEAKTIVLNQPRWTENWADENFNMPVTMALIFRYLDKPTIVSTFRYEEDYLHHSFWANLGLGVAKCFPTTYEPIIPLLETIARKTSTNPNHWRHHQQSR